MPLPEYTVPQYDLTLPSNKKKIKYRPFLVKEEKVLIIALETRNPKQITDAIKQVLSNCILTKGIKIEELPSFDIEYLFLNIRAKSIGESIELVITCGDDGETEVPVTLFVDEIQVQYPEGHTNKVDMENGYHWQMKYPSLNQFIENNFDVSEKSSENVERSVKLIASCMESVYNDEDCWMASDCTEKELIEYVEKLTPKQYKKIEQFFKTMPKLSHTLQVINPNTGKENSIVLEGLTDFFG
jgi:secreted Zn-dependent insulinase-like peptidase